MSIHSEWRARAQRHPERQRHQIQDPPAPPHHRGPAAANTRRCRLLTVYWRHGLLSSR